MFIPYPGSRSVTLGYQVHLSSFTFHLLAPPSADEGQTVRVSLTGAALIKGQRKDELPVPRCVNCCKFCKIEPLYIKLQYTDS
jgi:hypothetical protein